jgi:hypothetical protein
MDLCLDYTLDADTVPYPTYVDPCGPQSLLLAAFSRISTVYRFGRRCNAENPQSTIYQR